ncbi:MAG: MBL fold metallo-hydrolase [Deltaproteobacteria bacterium]|nr:MBL fold metallo-hydrolase [Candidatus Zymogenaceae bacterium]
MEIADGVFTYLGRLGDKIRPGAGSSSVTVVKGDYLVMIDTGVVSGGAFDDLVSRMKADGLDPRDVRLVVFTHAHWDHINAASKVISRSGAGTAAALKEIPYIEDHKKNFNAFIRDFAEFAGEIFPLPLPVARLLIRYAWGRQPGLTVSQSLDDGDTLNFGREIRAAALPGHTDGHMGCFIPDAGVLASGDLVDFENSEGMDLNNPRSSYESAVGSIKRAISLNPDILIPGHGEPVVGRQRVREMLEGGLAGGLEYPALIKGVLGKTPLRLKEILRAVFPGTPFSTEAMRMMLVLIVILYMEKRGEVRRVVKKGRPAWVLGEKQE